MIFILASQPEEDTVRRVLGMFENEVRGELDALPDTLNALRNDPAIETFALNDRMLQLAVELTDMELGLAPFA